MEYSVIGYKNTGFNANNYPDTAAQLAQFDTVDLQTVDLVQNVRLQTVRVAGDFDTLKNIDYVQIGDKYYQASTAPQGDANDVFSLTLRYDPITSNGGAASFSYADGVTVRHTTADDDMFEYTEPDPYCTPAQPLQIVNGGMLFNDTQTYAVVVESSIDLEALGEEFDEDGNLINAKGITFTVGDDSVVTPYTSAPSTFTTYTIVDESTATQEGDTRSAGTTIYEISEKITQDDQTVYVTNDTITKALGVVRSLAIEGSVLAQVVLPTEYISSVSKSTSAATVTSIAGKDQSVDSNIAFDQYTGINNNRVKYGEYNKYGLMTAKGDKGEYLPEQIGDSTDISPSIRAIADPRPSGRPYFRFTKYLGDETYSGFWLSCIAGLEWQNAPLAYTSASGSYMSNINFANDRTNAAAAREFENAQYQGQRVVNSIANVARTAGMTLDAVNPMAWMQGIGGTLLADNMTQLASMAYQTAALDQGEQYKQDLYDRTRTNALQNQAYAQSVVKPDIMFPFNADVIRDFVGNGVLVYRYKYTDADARRIDQILTMYGYRDTRRLTADMFNNRQYFDYVQATGVSIADRTIPQWERDEIADILSGGIRVWHVAPDPSYYVSGNPIKTTTTGDE